ARGRVRRRSRLDDGEEEVAIRCGGSLLLSSCGRKKADAGRPRARVGQERPLAAAAYLDQSRGWKAPGERGDFGSGRQRSAAGAAHSIQQSPVHVFWPRAE